MATDKGQSEASRGTPALVDAASAGCSGLDPQLVVSLAPRSPAAERYRVLARRIEPALASGARRVAVVSALGGEGRSTVAANLALALASGGRSRVALVDAHLRAPSLRRMLGAPALPGLVDILEGRATLAACSWRLEPGGLEILAAGHTDEPHALMASPVIARVLGELGERFDAVIVDAPPALPTADLLSLIGSVDAMLLVVHAGHTPRELIAAALRLVPSTRLLGAVLHRSNAGADAARRSRGGGAARGERQAEEPFPAAAPREATPG